MDGIKDFVGAAPCETQVVTYRNGINERLAETDGLSPISIAGTMDIVADQATISATIRLVDAVELSNLRATLLLYEDNVFWCCGYGGEDTWQHTTRMIYDENIVLSLAADEVFVETTVSIPAGAPPDGWVADELHAVVYVQNTATKEIYQGYLVGGTPPPDFSIFIDDKMESVPDGNGVVEFNGSVTNLLSTTDTITLDVFNMFGSWASEILVCGDNTPHSDAVAVELAPDETCEFTISVYTDAAIEIRDGVFESTSTASGRTQPIGLRIYNGSYSVMMVDDDGSHADDQVILGALDNLNVLYEHWDIYGGHGGASPGSTYMNEFDYVIWHHSEWNQSDPLHDSDVQTLMAYMDQGGSLLLTSQIFLNDPLGPASFISDYLGIASYTTEANYTEVTEVVGDPIGDGLSLVLDYTIPQLARGDDVEAGPTANVCMTAPGGVNSALRNEMENGAKSVFLAFPFEMIQADPDPNNPTVVMDRILTWLEPQSPADVIDGALVGFTSRIDGIMPNPFNPRTEIAISLSNSAASGPIRLEVFDLEGRLVRTIVDGTLTAGSHVQTWDGLADTGAPVQSGIYFAKLTTIEGISSDKLVLLK